MVIFFYHYQLIIADPIINYDDYIFIERVGAFDGLIDYIRSIFSERIEDIQPVRDLTFFINIVLYNLFGWSLFHLGNLLIYYLLVFSFYRLLLILKINTNRAILWTLIFLSHPIMVSNVSWISARKHTLAILFIVLAAIEIIKSKEISKKSIVFYTLSILSQPITLLAPGLIFTYRKALNINHRRTLILGMIGCLVLSLNLYKGFVLAHNNTYFIEKSYSVLFGDIVLSFGRAFQLVLFPLHQSITYYNGSPFNLFGLVIAIILILVTYKKLSRSKFFEMWTGFLCLWLLTAPYFTRDTYLFGVVGLAIIHLALILKSRYNKGVDSVLIVIFLIFSFKSVDYSSKWKTTKDLFLHSYIYEEDPRIGLMVARNLTGNPSLSIQFLKDSLEALIEPNERDLIKVAEVLIELGEIPLFEKVNLINKYFQKYPLKDFYLPVIKVYDTASSPSEGFRRFAELGETRGHFPERPYKYLKNWCLKNNSNLCSGFLLQQ